MDVSIIIVNYNTKKLLQNCINSIINHTKELSYEVIVSDNDSTDGSIEMIKTNFPEVILLENKANLGFGAANNRALEIAQGKYVFYLNSDTVICNNAVKLFFDFFENAAEPIGALGCNLVDDNLSIIHSYGLFPTKEKIIKNLIADLKQLTKRSLIFFLKSYSLNKESTSPKFEKKIGTVDYITGADLFMQNNELAKFDEYFFLYFEDTDLNKRLEQNNLQRLLIDGPIIKHLEHKSNKYSSQINYYSSFSKINYNLSSIKYLKKYGINKKDLFFAKLLLTLQWLNPFIISKSKKYLSIMWKI